MAQRPQKDLPISDHWASESDYISSLLGFATSSILFRHLCGGIHVLDFLTSEPDLYRQVLPEEWREWFDGIETWDLLMWVLYDEETLGRAGDRNEETRTKHFAIDVPITLREYIDTVRKLCLFRKYQKRDRPPMPRHLSVGMKPKKMHEVSSFAQYVSDLSNRFPSATSEEVSLVDFGSGQNYLGRTLASPPYNKHVIAIESKHHNVQGARDMDVHAKLSKKEKIMRNKKTWKLKQEKVMFEGLPTPPAEDEDDDEAVEVPEYVLERLAAGENERNDDRGSMTYIEHKIQSGDLTSILPSKSPRLMTISLHSCGNLSHHALRSLNLIPSVCAVAIIGCCYNLLTERLGPPTYKLPSLRPNHPRLKETANAFDVHGFPMSRKLEEYNLPDGEQGVRLNITARMMAVQAPYNWGREDSEMFFTRHYFRALLQKILLDYGVVKQAAVSSDGNSLSGKDETGTPLIIGSLPKTCFKSFQIYVRAALEKLYGMEGGEDISLKTAAISDDVIKSYEIRYAHSKKDLSIIWTLMAFSAGVVESIITVDRWQFLKEQDCVEEAWVEPVFDYALSPRNLCVIGIKKS